MILVLKKSSIRNFVQYIFKRFIDKKVFPVTYIETAKFVDVVYYFHYIFQEFGLNKSDDLYQPIIVILF